MTNDWISSWIWYISTHNIETIPRKSVRQTFLTRKKRMCGPGFRNHTLGYGDRGPKSYPWLWKVGQNQTLDNRKYHQKNPTFEAILYEIGQIWPKFCDLLQKNSGIRSKWPKFAKNIPLATESQPKLDHWLWKLGSKRDPCGWHTPSKVHLTKKKINKKNWGGCAAPVYPMPLAKEIFVKNIPLAKENFLIMSPFL